jgi:hypothetical protein
MATDSHKLGVYMSPLSKLFSRNKVNAKPNMAKLLLVYAENDSERIALLLNKWMEDEA